MTKRIKVYEIKKKGKSTTDKVIKNNLMDP